MKITHTLKFIVVAMVATLALGCGNSDLVEVSGLQGNLPLPEPTPEPTVEPDPVAHLRIANSNFLANNLVVLVDGQTVDNDLDPFEATTYIELEPGEHTIELRGQIQTQGTLESETVNLADGSASTFVFFNTDVPAQGVTTNTLLLTDDVTPTAGQLTGRLVNAATLRFNATLQDQNENDLLGPVREGNATSYSVIDTQPLIGTDSLIVFGDPVQGEDFTLPFETVDGETTNIVDALVAQLGTGGVNLTAVLSDSNFNLGEWVLMILVDDLETGDTVIISIFID